MRGGGLACCSPAALQCAADRCACAGSDAAQRQACVYICMWTEAPELGEHRQTQRPAQEPWPPPESPPSHPQRLPPGARAPACTPHGRALRTRSSRTDSALLRCCRRRPCACAAPVSQAPPARRSRNPARELDQIQGELSTVGAGARHEAGDGHTHRGRQTRRPANEHWAACGTTGWPGANLPSAQPTHSGRRQSGQIKCFAPARTRGLHSQGAGRAATPTCLL